MRIRTATLLCAISLCIAGCGHSDSASARKSITGDKGRIYEEIHPGETVRDDEELKLMVDAIVVYAPAGRISGSEQFWDVVLPYATAPDQQRLLDANGVRVGVMSEADWPNVKKIMESAPGVSSQTTMMAGAIKGWLDTRDLPRATMFYYDKQFRLQGRTIEDAETCWGIFYSPEPSHKNLVSLEAAPVIRSKQRQMKSMHVGDELEIEYVQAESIYDLGIRTQLPLGSVLVIAPSPDAAKDRSRLGSIMLLQDEQSTLSERILFLYPRAYRYSAKATEQAARAAGKDKPPEPQPAPPK